MGKWMDGYLSKLEISRQEVIESGGKERIEVQHSLGKLTARERIERLVDPGTFQDMGTQVRDIGFLGISENKSPADGVLIGNGRINGRLVMVYSMDFTVMSGAVGDQGIWKIADLVQMAGQEQVPVIGSWH